MISFGQMNENVNGLPQIKGLSLNEEAFKEGCSTSTGHGRTHTVLRWLLLRAAAATDGYCQALRWRNRAISGPAHSDDLTTHVFQPTPHSTTTKHPYTTIKSQHHQVEGRL